MTACVLGLSRDLSYDGCSLLLELKSPCKYSGVGCNMKIDFRSSQCKVWHGDLASLDELELSLIEFYSYDSKIIKPVLYNVLSAPDN